MNDPDVEAFLALIERHRRYMYNLAFRITGNEQDAKDVVQDSLLNAFVHFDRFEGRSDLRTWLNRILVNSALDHLRGLRRRPDVHDPRPISDAVASADCRRLVTAAMEAMSPLERVTFALRHFEGRSIAEIAQTVGIGSNAAKQHIFRAVRKLRLALKPHWSGQ